MDDRLRVVLDALAAELGDDLVATEQHRGDVWLRVRSEAWRRTAEACRSVGFDYFCFLSGLDWAPSTSVMRGEVASEVAEDEEADQADAAYPATAEVEPAEAPSGSGDGDGAAAPGSDAPRTGYAGGDSRFQVFARLYSLRDHLGIILKADLDEDAPAVESWSTVYAGADWHERETWEMFGFDFVGHPHLVHLYLPGEFEGFPLRKDYPLLAREVKPWPGLVDVEPMPASATDEAEPAAATAEGGEA
ncbi:MAG: NADH-quinone oxidoreductase subunit C [Acidimicrobiales bacterium]